MFADDLAWSDPSFAGGSIYVRSFGELARIDVATSATRVTHTDVAAVRSHAGQAAENSAFGRFLSQVQSAPAAKSAQIIDRFIAAQKSFPVIEGRETVNFVYRGPGDDVAVASDLFGSRQERSMQRVADTDLFVYTTQLEPDGRVNYLFIRDYEEILDPLNPRKTTTAMYGPDMEMSFRYTLPGYVFASTPQRMGHGPFILDKYYLSC